MVRNILCSRSCSIGFCHWLLLIKPICFKCRKQSVLLNHKVCCQMEMWKLNLSFKCQFHAKCWGSFGYYFLNVMSWVVPVQQHSMIKSENFGLLYTINEAISFRINQWPVIRASNAFHYVVYPATWFVIFTCFECIQKRRMPCYMICDIGWSPSQIWYM